jgi:diguanylate cyclase (GGDEF)-like protein/PAS domain S-box-containing protein
MATILVVDDHVINREFLVTLLGYANHIVLQAADGKQALEVVRSQRPDLIISDVLMPAMSGIEFANALHADAAIADIPMIFHTATYRLHEARTLAQACGVSTVLPKPSEPQIILDAVASVLGITMPVLPATTDGLPGSLGAKLPAYMHELSELQQRLQHALEQGLELIGEDGVLRQTSDNLLHSFATVQGLSMRLAALLELGLALNTEREPQLLLDMFCRAAHDIMNARYVTVGILDAEGRRLQLWSARGMSQEAADAFVDIDPHAGVFGKVLATDQPQRMVKLNGDPQAAGLFKTHPPIESLLTVPVRSTATVRGWLYCADKLGTTEFSDEDEQFAVTLAAQLALTYENLVQHDEIQQHAVRLEMEIIERQRASAELGESELRFRQLAENIHEVFYLIAPRFAPMYYISPAYEDIWGRSRESLYANPVSWAEAMHPDDRERVFMEIAPEGTLVGHDSEYRIVRPDGSQRWIRARGFPIYNEAGEVYRVAGIAEDITQLKEQQQKIARLARIYAVLSGINSAIVRIHDRGELLNEACRIAVAEGAFRMAWVSALNPQTLQSKVIASCGVDVQYLDKVKRTALYGRLPGPRAIREKKPIICNNIAIDPELATAGAVLLKEGVRSGAAFPLIVNGEAVAALSLCATEIDFFDAQELELLNELAGDIAFGLQYIEKEEKLNYLAYYDALTGLANGTLFRDRLTQFLHGARHSKGIVAVILIDLDRFTQLNDTLGRHIGDELLRIVAARFRDYLEEPYSLSRINTDLYAIALADLASGTDAATVVRNRILRSLGQAVTLGGKEIRLSAKAGIALYPGDGEDADILFKNAEAALKHAQSSGEDFSYYAPEINATAAEKLALESKLHKAVEQQQFVLHYQPKFDAVSGRMVGLEALMRWNDPDNGLVAPVKFISVLEQTGLILNAGRWALEQALTDYRSWLEQGLQPPRIAVNVSPIQLKRQNFTNIVREVIDHCGTTANALEIEITEGLLMEDTEANTRTLHEIRELGVKIAVDDFGTGYSSLRYLAKLPVDTLKIDRSFIITMVNDRDSMAIVSAIVSLAHLLGLNVVAEGVDSEEQAKALRLMKCDELQGYLLSKPMPFDAVTSILRKNLKGQ